MKDHPILFNTDMVKAILAGNKTMTRRVVNPQPVEVDPNSLFLSGRFKTPKGKPLSSPYGYEEDLLWVRETWAFGRATGFTYYRASHAHKRGACFDKWKPSIHMPKKFARVWLKVIGVRVERLQDISEKDAMAEGSPMLDKDGVPYLSAKTAFMALWDRINFKRGYGWGNNPWIWVVEFERAEKPQAAKDE